jgi:prevent-host-death family protein
MKKWPVQDAKNQLSKVIDLARSQGPQVITRHGQPVVVVLAASEFKKLQKPAETPLEFLSRFAGAGLASIRRKDLPRKIVL